MSKNWSESEVELAVADYFQMLGLELRGEKYNKSQHRRALLQNLNGRTEGSVELKHQNISAVLIEMGIPFIIGYKPRFNYQRSLLPDAVSDYLRRNSHLLELFRSDTEMTPAIPRVEDILAVWDLPPERAERQTFKTSEHKPYFNPININYLEQEARNQSLGAAGEVFVINYERARLIRAGKGYLADLVEQVSETVGPAAGYDIRSYQDDGSDRFIEAKTTKYGKSTPFYLTPNELQFSKDNAKSYFLYRVFGFRENPRLFTLQGSIDDHCLLEPSEFRARLG